MRMWALVYSSIGTSSWLRLTSVLLSQPSEWQRTALGHSDGCDTKRTWVVVAGVSRAFSGSVRVWVCACVSACALWHKNHWTYHHQTWQVDSTWQVLSPILFKVKRLNVTVTGSVYVVTAATTSKHSPEVAPINVILWSQRLRSEGQMSRSAWVRALLSASPLIQHSVPVHLFHVKWWNAFSQIRSWV